MTWKKGESGNAKGKPVGAVNKTTAQMKGMLNAIMAKQWDKVDSALKKLYEENPEKYVDVITKYFPYVIPKKVDITSDDEPIKTEINITVDSKETGDILKKLRDGAKAH